MKIKITLLFYLFSFLGFSQNFVDPQTPSGAQPANALVGTGWKLDFSDEFKGSYVNTTKWTVDNSTTSRTATPKIGVDYWFWKPGNVAMDGDNLVLKVSKENSNTMYCGSVNSKGKYLTQYGYIEVRVKIADASKGTHTAFWMLGPKQGQIDGTGNDGAEIDVFESAWLNDYTQITMHIDGYKDARQSKSVGYSPTNMHQGFHTWGLLWTKDSLTVYYDGTYMTSVKDIKWIPWNEEYLWLSDGADFVLSGDSYFKNQDTGPLTEAYVDYVRVWKKPSEIHVGNNTLLNGGFDNQYNSWNCTNVPIIENNTTNSIKGKTCLLPVLTGGHVLRQIVNVKPGRIYNFGYKGRIQDLEGASGTHVNSEMLIAYYPKDTFAPPALKGMILDQDYNKLLELNTQSPVNDTLSKLIEAIERSRRNVFPVLDDEKNLVGVILLDNVREIIFDRHLYSLIVAGDIMTTPDAIVDVKDKMYDIVKKLDELNAWNLPVVNDGKYLGFISKANILSHYRDLLVKQTQG